MNVSASFRPLRLLAVIPMMWLASCDSGGGGGGGPRNVLVIGDSISGATIYPGVAPWPVLLRGMKPEWSISNSSNAGDTSGDGAARVEAQLDAVQPDVLVIFLGTNDAIRSLTGSFESNLTYMIQAGKAYGAKVKVCTLPPLYGIRTLYSGNLNAVNATIRSVAAREGAGVIHCNGEFDPADGDLFPDGIHPNADGQAILAVTIREKL